MLTEYYNQTPPITTHVLSQLSQLHHTPPYYYAIGIWPIYILATDTKHLARTYLLSPNGVSTNTCDDLHMQINPHWHDHIKIIRYQPKPYLTKEESPFFSTMRQIIVTVRSGVQDALFTLCRKFQSRTSQQQRFIDMPLIQQNIAQAYAWLDLAKPLDSISHHEHQLNDLEAYWDALLRCTEALCQLSGAIGLIKNGYRDLYWIVLTYSQALKAGKL